ncbi:MAG TPA: glycosyltransferase family 4 protein [Flavobacterium sp.]|nr:glycosyltransferase family 4 protein [Flavobacterium sp.]
MKILVVSGFIPYPPVFGGAIDVWERIKGLHALGYEIDLAVTDKVNPSQEQLDEIKIYVRHFFFVRRENKVQQLFNKLPLQLLSRKGLSTIDIHQTYDTLILESEFCWAITLNQSITYKNIVVRVHNIESHYFKALGKSSNSLREKIYYKMESNKIKNLSEMVFDKVDKLWFISKDDLLLVNKPNKSVFMPFPINSEMVKPVPNSAKNVLYIGALFMQNNLYGLDWYIENVHSELLQIKDYQFVIVGSTKDNRQELNKKYGNLPNVRLFLDQPDITPFYQKAGLFINPMFHGSGVKVKSVNALVNGVPLVSTDIGAEGIGLTDEMFFRANNTEDFVTKIKHIFNVPADAVNRTQTAQQYLQEINYTNILQDELG